MRVIAEVGSNWKSLMDCALSIKEAKSCGADAVKFQLFSPKELYGSDGSTKSGTTPYLDPEWIHRLFELCQFEGIEFMCTAFSPHGYKFIDNYVETHKIASAEITDKAILEMVNSFKKPVYLSTGGASIDQVASALFILKDCPVTIFYCVTEYPAKIVDFRHLETLRETFGSQYKYGYSDHSIDVLNIPKMAYHHDCSVIEKHVNFTPYADTNDAPHALNAKELALMVKAVKGIEIPLPETFTGCSWQRQLTDDGYFRPIDL